VPKAAFAARGNRPTALKHYETIACTRSVPPPTAILVVDDIVTKGATLLGSASSLLDVFDGVRIAAFTAMRTLGLQPDIEELVAPCIGTIQWDGRDADRRPWRRTSRPLIRSSQPPAQDVPAHSPRGLASLASRALKNPASLTKSEIKKPAGSVLTLTPDKSKPKAKKP
jgi:hypothetical protein